jgi:hypothetical protein
MSRAWPDMLRRYLDAPHESERPYCENEGEAIPDENPTRSSGFALARAVAGASPDLRVSNFAQTVAVKGCRLRPP